LLSGEDVLDSESLEDSLGFERLVGGWGFVGAKRSAVPTGVGRNASCPAIGCQDLVAVLPFGHRPVKSLPGVEARNV